MFTVSNSGGLPVLAVVETGFNGLLERKRRRTVFITVHAVVAPELDRTGDEHTLKRVLVVTQSKGIEAVAIHFEFVSRPLPHGAVAVLT